MNKPPQKTPPDKKYAPGPINYRLQYSGVLVEFRIRTQYYNLKFTHGCGSVTSWDEIADYLIVVYLSRFHRFLKSLIRFIFLFNNNDIKNYILKFCA